LGLLFISAFVIHPPDAGKKTISVILGTIVSVLQLGVGINKYVIWSFIVLFTCFIHSTMFTPGWQLFYRYTGYICSFIWIIFGFKHIYRYSRKPPKHYPNHIAIIPDGNRRHALSKYYDKLMGYKFGGSLFTKVIQWASTSNVKELSLYAWSEENWSRPQKEINTMLNAVEKQLDIWNVAPIQNIRFHFVSTSSHKVPKNIRDKMKQLEETSKNNTGVMVYMYFSYGFNKEHQQKDHFLPKTASHPDLLIRTGGQKRLSNFCMSQLIYTELCFVDDFFPSCNDTTWNHCVKEYNKRNRKYGH